MLGDANYLSFLTEVEQDQWGVGLFKGKFSGKFIIFRPVDPSTITWIQSMNNINTVWVKSISVFDLQKQVLITVSDEKYSDPTNREKLSQLNKEKGERDQI